MGNISLDLSHAGIREEEILAYGQKVNSTHSDLSNPDHPLKEFSGWMESPRLWMEKVSSINELAGRIRNQSEVLFVIGIGGSYLGSKAIIKSLKPTFFNREATKNHDLEIFFTGNNLNTDYIYDLLQVGREKDFSIIVISKSGTTLEPALSFRLFRDLLEEKYGEAHRERVYVITDEESGLLKQIADNRGYEKLPVPKDIGGRYSVLSPVGLLPIATAGIDIYHLLEGAVNMKAELDNADLEQNIAYRYAVARNIWQSRGKSIEIMGNYDHKLHYFAEWWKQLFSETEGKGGKGLFPVSVNLTTDLHSLGQMIQDGPRIMIETILNVESTAHQIEFFPKNKNEDELQYIEGKTLDFINKKAFEGTVRAHTDGGVPNIIFNIPALIDYNMGQLVFLFEKACVMSALLLGVNPYDQPGVENYKNNLFELLGKPK